MNAYQKNKLENSRRLLKVLLGLLLEMKDFARKHRKEPKTLMVDELFSQLADNVDEPLWVIRREHENGKEAYEAKPVLRMVAEMIGDIEEELRVLGKEDKHAA